MGQQGRREAEEEKEELIPLSAARHSPVAVFRGDLFVAPVSGEGRATRSVVAARDAEAIQLLFLRGFGALGELGVAQT